MGSTISVRPVNLGTDSSELFRILQENLPALPHERRFQWLYRDNPDGPAWSWFVVETASGSVKGVTSVFPRSMWVGRRTLLCGQVGDFAISATHRSLGPALLLQRATFQPVDDRVLAFCYDCPPHSAGMATFNRLRIKAHCAVTRYVLPLRLDTRIKKKLGFRPPAMVSLMNALLHISRHSGVKPGDLDIAEFAGRFGEEFSLLDAAVTSDDGIRGHRSAAHLNWRYRQDPLQQYSVLAARRKGELLAYLVFSVGNGNIRIVDLFGKDPAVAAVVLLDALAKRYELSCESIEAFLSEGSDVLSSVLKACFRRRYVAAQVVAYSRAGGEMAQFLERRPRWAFGTAELQA